ncbi:hypothetical protein EVAR_56208_1 [Eumeta japonica]|uniref:Uncharacterized protein n=1 Tax=Eumeta variegata TaxID=151549 RepID=A0A4C1Y498_EUMVA|nr:hypothetical protein EVAR_56208_1 [Eumeta japonica]
MAHQLIQSPKGPKSVIKFGKLRGQPQNRAESRRVSPSPTTRCKLVAEISRLQGSRPALEAVLDTPVLRHVDGIRDFVESTD